MPQKSQEVEIVHCERQEVDFGFSHYFEGAGVVHKNWKRHGEDVKPLKKSIGRRIKGEVLI